MSRLDYSAFFFDSHGNVLTSNGLDLSCGLGWFTRRCQHEAFLTFHVSAQVHEYEAPRLGTEEVHVARMLSDISSHLL
jgi:hypothetical protein